MANLICFHHAGGAPTVFRTWLAATNRDFDVIPVTLPTTKPLTGRRIHDSPDDLVTQLIAEHADALREPHVLYGHSMGGLLAYLTARRLVRADEYASPSALIIGATWSPRMRPVDDADQLDDAALIARLTRMGGLPAELATRPEWLTPMLPIVRDDLRMCSTYAHDFTDDTLDIPVYVIGAEADHVVSREQLLGWADLGENVSIEYQPGGHFFDVDPAAFRNRVFALAAEALAGPA